MRPIKENCLPFSNAPPLTGCLFGWEIGNYCQSSCPVAVYQLGQSNGQIIVAISNHLDSDPQAPRKVRSLSGKSFQSSRIPPWRSTPQIGPQDYERKHAEKRLLRARNARPEGEKYHLLFFDFFCLLNFQGRLISIQDFQVTLHEVISGEVVEPYGDPSGGGDQWSFLGLWYTPLQDESQMIRLLAMSIFQVYPNCI